MNALDHRLYAWLTEPDAQRFERAFDAYFSVAFPAVVRYLSRLSHWEPQQLEDLAQEALLRFFDRAGRARRTAADSVVSALARLRPLPLGSFHERQLKSWIDEIAKFTNAAMGFRVLQDEAAAKTAIHEFAERIDMLLRQAEQMTHGLPDAEHRSAAAETFLNDVRLVVGCLPLLRVPTNSFLFQIARSIFLDECKKQGRQKRGGDYPSPHPLESPDVADGFDDAPEEIPVFAAHAQLADPARDYENEEFFQKFHEYLRAPLDRAADAYQRASASGQATAERHRLDSLAGKFARTMAVLSAIGEGHTQEQVAERLGLSRNQVKYIVELVQEAFAQFVRTADPSATTSSIMREPSHAR